MSRLHRIAQAATAHARGRTRLPTHQLLDLLRDLEPDLEPDQLPDELAEIIEDGNGVVWQTARTATTLIGTHTLPKFVLLHQSPPERDTRRPVDVGLRRELDWAAGLPLSTAQRNVVEAVNQWLRAGGDAAPWVTTRERAYQLLADEKAFDGVTPRGGKTLWQPERLTFDLLRCHRARIPLTWEPVDPTAGSDTGPLLIVENEATYYSALQALRHIGPAPGRYIAVAYTVGNQAATRLAALPQLPIRPTWAGYLGDLDLAGLKIAGDATRTCHLHGVPTGPADALWRMLVDQPDRPADKAATPSAALAATAWLPDDIAADAAELLAAGRRIPQEALRYDLLASDPHWASPGPAR